MFRLQDFIGHYSQALFSTDMKESVSKACATESENSILNFIFFFFFLNSDSYVLMNEKGIRNYLNNVNSHIYEQGHKYKGKKTIKEGVLILGMSY